EGAGPRKFSCAFVVTRSRIVMKAMLFAVVNINCVDLVVGFQCRFVGRDSRVHSLIISGVMKQKWCSYPGHVIRSCLSPIKRNACIQISSESYGQLIYNAATKTKSDSAQFACRIRSCFKPLRRCDEVFRHLLAIDGSKCSSAFLVVAGIASN